MCEFYILMRQKNHPLICVYIFCFLKINLHTFPCTLLLCDKQGISETVCWWKKLPLFSHFFSENCCCDSVRNLNDTKFCVGHIVKTKERRRIVLLHRFGFNSYINQHTIEHHVYISNFLVDARCVSSAAFSALIGFCYDALQSGNAAFWLVDAWSHICFMQEAWILSFHTPFERNMGKMWHKENNREETSRQLRKARWVKKEERTGQEASRERGRTRGQGRKRTKQRGVISENIGREADQKGNLVELQYFSFSFLTPCPPTLLHSAGPLCKQTNLRRQGQGLVRRVW